MDKFWLYDPMILINPNKIKKFFQKMNILCLES